MSAFTLFVTEPFSLQEKQAAKNGFTLPNGVKVRGMALKGNKVTAAKLSGLFVSTTVRGYITELTNALPKLYAVQDRDTAQDKETLQELQVKFQPNDEEGNGVAPKKKPVDASFLLGTLVGLACEYMGTEGDGKDDTVCPSDIKELHRVSYLYLKQITRIGKLSAAGKADAAVITENAACIEADAAYKAFIETKLANKAAK